MTDKDECLELKNIKYQTMLLNNNSKTIYTKPNVTNIEHFLQKEKELNKDLYFSPGIFFYSYDILLFVIECDGIYEGLYDNEGEYRDKRPIEMLKMKNATLRDKYLFYNIREEDCYNNLESLTKKNINILYLDITLIIFCCFKKSI